MDQAIPFKQVEANTGKGKATKKGSRIALGRVGKNGVQLGIPYLKPA